MKAWLKIIPILVLTTGSTYTFGKSVSLYCVPERITYMPIGNDVPTWNGPCAEFKLNYKNKYQCSGFNLTFDSQGKDALKEFGGKYVLPLVSKSTYEYHFKLDERTDVITDIKELKVDRRNLSFNYTDYNLVSFGAAGNAGIVHTLDGSCEILDAAPVETLI